MTRLLEHHSLSLVRDSGVEVPPYRVSRTAEEAERAAGDLGGRVVVKALVPVGGRGKQGAVVFADDPRAAADRASRLLGTQVGAFPVDRVLVQARVDVSAEFFCAFTFDPTSRAPLVLFSAEGGVDIEALTREKPVSLVRRTFAPGPSFPLDVGEAIASEAGLATGTGSSLALTLAALYHAFRVNDAVLVEINPLVVDAQSRAVALSAVVTVDDQAPFRHPEWEAWEVPGRTNGWRPLTPLEERIREIDATDDGSAIRFNELEGGRIACLITGGGAGMVSFDQFRKLGKHPPPRSISHRGRSKRRCIWRRRPSSSAGATMGCSPAETSPTSSPST